MTNKYECYLSYKKFYKRDIIGCYNRGDYEEFCKFVCNHNEFIFKPLTEHSGHGIAKVKADSNLEKFFFDKINQGPFIVEEVIVQNQLISSIHPESINSFRVVTFTINHNVYVLGVTWRIGVGNSIMDNAGSGGIYAAVDPSIGIVVTEAINYKGDKYYLHPDTKIQIIGYKIPHWDDAITLINQMAKHIQGTTLVSWDIAYSDKGWVMIEANDNGDWSIIQSNRKEGKKYLLYKYMDEFFKNNITI